MIIQEPVQAAIWHCLNHYSYVDAIFLAERLYAEVDTDEALFLLATCYFRSGKPNRAYSILQNKGCISSQCRFLLARCCLELNKLNEVEAALSGGNVVNGKSNNETTSEFGDSACFVEQLVGGICERTERHKKAADSYRKSLKLNPFLWSSYDALCILGEKPDPNKIFQVSSLENFNMCQGSNPLVQLVNLAHNTDSAGQNYNSLDNQEINSSSTPVQLLVSSHTTPLSTVAVVQTASSTEDLLSLEQQSGLLQVPSTVGMQTTQSTVTTTAPISRSRYSCFRSFFGDAAAMSPLTPSFGLLPLDSVSPLDSTQNCTTYVTPPTSLLIESQLGDQKLATKKSQVVRKSQTLNPTSNKPTVFSQSGNASNTTKVNNITSSPTSQATLQPSAMASVRRSTRLFSSSNSVKENNKSSSKVRFTSSKTPPRKAKTRLSKNSVTQATFNELNEINKTDTMSTENKPGIVSTSHHAVTIQKAVAEGLMLLLQDLGKAYLHLAQYDCRLAIKAFRSLPPRHYNTGWVLTNLGRAHFELAEYQQADEIFAAVRLLEPHRMEGLEYYSTTLWHLQREIGLSTLAKVMTDFEKNCPQAWCAVGNCYSLQKEHDTAIKFFQRAVQVDPKFAYAYTLLGHEYVLTEEMDKAMSCFRNAIRIDPRHYNAWYGVGMIFFKQEKFQLAELHFKRALHINSQSSVLMCHIGVVQHNLQRSDCALETFNRAIASDPKNPLCKFQRATVYFTTDRPHEALNELEELKELVPKESLVYFLLGKVHKKLGNTHLALMNFSWAMDLDPKGANNQIKEAIDKRYTNDDDDVIATNDTVLEESQAVDMEIIDQVSQHGLVVNPEDDHLPTSDESL